MELSIPPQSACPYCKHPEALPRAPATYTCAMIGCLVGAAGGFHASVKGLPIAKLATPALIASGFAFTGVAGAVVAALSAAAVGCEFGAKAGAKIDLMLFDNFRCSNCQRTFKT